MHPSIIDICMEMRVKKTAAYLRRRADEFDAEAAAYRSEENGLLCADIAAGKAELLRSEATAIENGADLT